MECYMKCNTQSMKISKVDLLIVLMWVPVFILAYYILIENVITGMQIILYPMELSLMNLGIKILAAMLNIITIFVIVWSAITYYSIIRNLIRAYKLSNMDLFKL